jgi:hypothetical protein
MDPLQTRPAVEIGVKAQDRSNPMAFHDGDVGLPNQGRCAPFSLSRTRFLGKMPKIETASD